MFNTYIQFLRELLCPIKGISLNTTEKAIIAKISPKLLEFRKNFTILTKIPVSVILDDLSKVLGYGEGSTPLSDDVFLGMVATIYSLESDVEKEFEILSKIPFERFTTSKSSQLCRDFVKRNFPHEIESYLKLIRSDLSNSSTRVHFKQEINKICNIGGSSGKFFLFGSFWELCLREFGGSFDKF
ncbi:MAG: DUF2877 domain-containing protein [Candidatus Hodarchaeota archaeon]